MSPDYSQSNTIGDSETKDVSGPAGRTNQAVADGRRKLARQELGDGHHRCSICDTAFDDVDELATHECGGDS